MVHTYFLPDSLKSYPLKVIQNHIEQSKLGADQVKVEYKTANIRWTDLSSRRILFGIFLNFDKIRWTNLMMVMFASVKCPMVTILAILTTLTIVTIMAILWVSETVTSPSTTRWHHAFMTKIF